MKAYFELTHSHHRGLFPTEKFLEELADNLVRTDSSKPGHIMIPDTRRLGGTVDYAHMFQINTLNRFHTFLEYNAPHALTPEFMDMRHSDSEEIHATSELIMEPVDIDGLDSFRRLHHDSFRRMYVGLSYGNRGNVTGGFPRLFDELQYCQETGKSIDSIRHVKLAKSLNYSPESRAHKYETFAFMKGTVTSRRQKFQTVYDDLMYSKIPMLFFNNRKEAGLMHGATHLTKRRFAKRRFRALRYIALAYEIPDGFLSQ